MNLTSEEVVARGGPLQPNLKYDAFISYRSETDYSLARKLESFLEAFHKSTSTKSIPVRQMQICRDGSDFRLPKAHEEKDAEDDHDQDLTEHERKVWNIIRGELELSRYLIVLCSPGAVASRYVDREVRWFVEHRGAEFVLPVVANAVKPKDNPEECFPKTIITEGLNQSRIWYDLRGHRRGDEDSKFRDYDDEQIRLAGDLLEWDTLKHGQLAAIWQREQSKRRRRQAFYLFIAAILFLSLGAFSLVSALQRQKAIVDRDNALDQRDKEVAKAEKALVVRDSAINQREEALRRESEALAKEKIAATRAIRSAEEERKARLLAEGRRREAERQSQITLTRQLSAQSRLLIDHPGTLQELGTLLAIEAAKRQQQLKISSVETDQNLRYALSQRLQPVYEVRHPSAVLDVAVSPDGNYLASYSSKKNISGNSDQEALVIVTDLRSGRRIKEQQLTFSFAYLGGITFTPGGKYIVIDLVDDSVWTWDWKTDTKPIIIKASINTGVTPPHFDYKSQYVVFEPALWPVTDTHIKVYSMQTGIEIIGLRNIEKISNPILSPATPLVASREKTEVKLWSLDDTGFTAVGSLKSERLDNKSFICGFSRTGLLFVCHTSEGDVIVWRVADREEIASFHSDSTFTTFAFDVTEAQLAAADTDGLVTLWDISSKRRVMRRYPGGRIRQLAFTTEGECLALVEDGERVRLWRSNSGTYEMVQHEQQIIDSTFTPDLQYLVTSSLNGTARAWKVKRLPLSEQVLKRNEFQLGVNGDFVTFTNPPNGQGPATSLTSQLWNTTSRKVVGQISHKSNLQSTAVTADGRYFASAEYSGRTVILKDIARDVEVLRISHPTFVHESISGSEAGINVSWKLNWPPGNSKGYSVFQARDFSRTVPVTYVDHIKAGVYAGKMRPPTATRSVSVSSEPFSEGAVSSGAGGNLSDIDIFAELKAMAISNDGKILVTSILDQVWLWETSNGKQLAHLEQGYEVEPAANKTGLEIKLATVDFLAFSPNDKYLLSVSRSGVIRIWDLASERWLQPHVVKQSFGSLRGGIFMTLLGQVVFSSDSQFVVYPDLRNQLRVLRLRDFREVATLPTQGGLSMFLEFSRNSHYFASVETGSDFSNADNLRPRTTSIVRIWDTHTWKVRHTIDYHGFIGDVSFHPSENYFVTSDQDKTVRMWDIVSGQELGRITYPEQVLQVLFNTTGRSLLVRTTSGLMVSQWQVDDLIMEACRRLTRNLSASEWQYYIGMNPTLTCSQLAW